MANGLFDSPNETEKSAWQWLCTNEAKKWLSQEMSNTPATHFQFVRRLGRGLSPEATMLVAEQLRLRQKAIRKFDDPERWFWTRTLLEQASDQFVSCLMSSFVPKDTLVFDLCCGAGADTVALAQQYSDVVAVDCNWLACHLTRSNLANHALTADVRQQDVQAITIPTGAWIHADPDRRVGDRRSTHVEHLSPSIETMLSWMDRSAGGSIKLAPATESISEVTARFGKQWIGWGGSVRQQRWWWGANEFSGHTITASVRDSSGTWHHFRKNIDECISSAFEPDIKVSQWIGDCDPTIRASGMLNALAQDANATIIGMENGYLTSDKPIQHPMLHWFRVQDLMPMDIKRLRKHLQSKEIGILEIKTRGVDISPDALRPKLKLKGKQSASLLITRNGQRTIAIMANRC